MLFLWQLVLGLCCVLAVVNGENVDTYMQNRNNLVQSEVDMSLAGNVVLNSKEVLANNILTALQAKEVVVMGDNFPPSLNFFVAHPWIDNSSIVFPLLKQMPKGAALHQHLDSTGSYDYLVYNLTYQYPCFMYQGDGLGEYEVGTIDCFNLDALPTDGPWVSLKVLRNANPNFDSEFLANMTMATRDYGDYYQLWQKFDFIFGLVSMLNCKEIRAAYLAHLFAELKEDNIQHAEFRTGIVLMHDLDNNNYTFSQFIEMFEEIAIASNFSAKIIWAAFRQANTSEVMQDMLDTIQIMKVYPNTLIGFDLDGPEDEGHPLIYYINEFLQAENISQNNLRFYFHAGESTFPNNTNLYDAVLLNTTRIGHGFQLAKHPILLEEVKSRGICLEVCPISNQVLELSPDLRTHPGYEYFNRGIPMSLSSDDPAIYGYEGISYDFYEAFMAWNLDIRGLKQLALNSIKCSTWANEKEEALVFNEWQSAWNAWIDEVSAVAN